MWVENSKVVDSMYEGLKGNIAKLTIQYAKGILFRFPAVPLKPWSMV